MMQSYATLLDMRNSAGFVARECKRRGGHTRLPNNAKKGRENSQPP
jgi:hypothetical protein